MTRDKEDLEIATQALFHRPNNTRDNPQVAIRKWWEMSCEECDRVLVQGRRPSGPDEQCAALHLINCPTHRERWDRLVKEFKKGGFPR